MAAPSAAAAIAGIRSAALLPASLPPLAAATPTSVARPRRFSTCRSSFSYRNNGTPETECPVPLDQQPVNEYQHLTTSLPFSWAAGDIERYWSRLALIGASFALFVGLPVAAFGKGYVTADPKVEGVKIALGAASTGIWAVTLAVLRIYLGWAYVGNRLLSATVEYEETGWYDGQVWVKTPEVLARDRLLGSFSVKPVLNRVKLTLVGLAISLVACTLLFIYVESPKDSSLEAAGGSMVSGVYNDESARSFEADAFCGDASLS